MASDLPCDVHAATPAWQVTPSVQIAVPAVQANIRFGDGHRWQPGGHYETRNVQVWVDGRWQQVYVAPVCTSRGRWGRHQRCTEGGYQNVWQEGHYETVQQQVWVQDFARPHYQAWAFR